MSEATITCYCGSSALYLVDGAATCFFQCGCNSCRQKIQFAQARGGREFVPLPKLFYMPSVISSLKGKEHLKAFQLRKNTASTQIYCSNCWAILGVDHVNYPESIFLNFPEFCVNTGDLSVSLSAYIMMSDYDEEIGPEPPESVPLFESIRYQQERERLFALPDAQQTFTEPDEPLAGYTFRSLLAELEPPTILNISESSNVLTEFQ
ncbi:MAG: hypothetical protein ACJ0Q1_00040 [Luminiphilus sp.]